MTSLYVLVTIYDLWLWLSRVTDDIFIHPDTRQVSSYISYTKIEIFFSLFISFSLKTVWFSNMMWFFYVNEFLSNFSPLFPFVKILNIPSCCHDSLRESKLPADDFGISDIPIIVTNEFPLSFMKYFNITFTCTFPAYQTKRCVVMDSDAVG